MNQFLEGLSLITTISVLAIILLWLYYDMKDREQKRERNDYKEKVNSVINPFVKIKNYHPEFWHSKYQHYYEVYSDIENRIERPATIIIKFHKDLMQWIRNHGNLDDFPDQNLQSFIVDPIKWFTPRYLPFRKYFYGQSDKESYKIGLMKMEPVFKELEELICLAMGIDLNRKSQKKIFLAEKILYLRLYFKKTKKYIVIIILLLIILTQIIKI